jgi:hypothetical protein
VLEHATRALDPGTRRGSIGLIAGDPVPCGVEPDFNHDGNVDQDDLADFIHFVGGSPCPW